MSQTRNSFHVITLGDRIFEVWAPDVKQAKRCANFKEWARSKSHVGLRRILRTVPGEQWPVVIEEANYLTAARVDAEKKRAYEEALKQSAILSEGSAARRKAAEEAAHARRAEEIRVDRAARQQRRDALDRRLGRKRPCPSLPTQDPDIGEWI